jgi:hypothetical protein
MSDIAGAADPGAGTGGAPAPLSPVLESFADAATNKIAVLKSDYAWGKAWVDGSVAHRNELKTLLEISKGGRAEPDQVQLADSIGLKRTASLGAAERQRDAAAAADAALRPNLGEFGRALGVEQATATHEDLASWASGLQLPQSIARTVLQRVADEGARVAKMSPDERSAWRQRQDDLLLGAAYSDKSKVDAWRAAATKVVAGSRYNFNNAFTLNDAFIIRALALAGSAKK